MQQTDVEYKKEIGDGELVDVDGVRVGRVF